MTTSRFFTFAVLSALFSVACASNTSTDEDASDDDSESDSGNETDTNTGSDSSADDAGIDAGADTDGDTDTDTDTDTDADNDTDTDADSDTGLDAGTLDSGTDAGPDLSGLVGRYAERTVIVTSSTLQTIGTFTTNAHYYGFADLALADGGLVVTSVSCHSNLETTSPVKASMDDAVVRSLPPFIGKVTTTVDNGVLAIEREELVMPLGVNLTDPWNEALPTTSTDPRVWDQDEDGKPGISVKLKGPAINATVYAVRRERGWWDAKVVDDIKLSGLVHDSSEQSVIGATNPLFNTNMNEIQDPDPNKHTFDLVRLDGDWDCDRLVAEIGTIFGD